MLDFDNFIIDLQKLVSFKSVKGEKKDNMPFGEEVYKALNFVLSRAKDFGFNVINYDNYAGEVTIGSGSEIGIMGHLDVVPEGKGWNTDPYELTLIKDTYFGRGVIDDKAPILLCLYVLKELKESGIKINKKFRLFFGTNEETDWKDVEYLSKKTKMPTYGFSPDGDFPVTYAEKGIYFTRFYLPLLKNFNCVKGGTVANAVCAYASANTNLNISQELLQKYKIVKTGNKIESVGVSAHGSKPQEGVNALKPLFLLFKDCGEDVSNAIDCLFNDKYGLFNVTSSEGNITMSPDLIQEKDGKLVITADIRVPYPITEKQVRNIINKFGIEYDIDIKHPTLCVDKNSELVSVLLNAYNGYMKTDLKPKSQGGSTFARVFTKGVSFGPEFPFITSTLHCPNEQITKKEIIDMYEIYKRAIFNLAK